MLPNYEYSSRNNIVVLFAVALSFIERRRRRRCLSLSLSLSRLCSGKWRLPLPSCDRPHPGTAQCRECRSNDCPPVSPVVDHIQSAGWFTPSLVWDERNRTMNARHCFPDALQRLFSSHLRRPPPPAPVVRSGAMAFPPKRSRGASSSDGIV